MAIDSLTENIQIFRSRVVTGIIPRFSIFLKENIHRDPSLELSLRDSSNEGSQSMFLWKNKDNNYLSLNYPCYSFQYGALNI